AGDRIVGLRATGVLDAGQLVVAPEAVGRRALAEVDGDAARAAMWRVEIVAHGVITVAADEFVLALTSCENVCAVIAFDAVVAGVAGDVEIAVAGERDIGDAGGEGERSGDAGRRVDG